MSRTHTVCAADSTQQVSSAVAEQARLSTTTVPLHLETRTALPTNEAAFHLGRRPQTLRRWASDDSGPVRPTRVCGRLAWSVNEIKRVLGVQQ